MSAELDARRAAGYTNFRKWEITGPCRDVGNICGFKDFTFYVASEGEPTPEKFLMTLFHRYRMEGAGLTSFTVKDVGYIHRSQLIDFMGPPDKPLTLFQRIFAPRNHH